MHEPPSSRPPVRSRRRWSAARWLLGALVSCLSTSTASAQSDINPPLPNVMLLVDTSGSMENKITGGLPICSADGALESERSRWVDLVEVLTGTIQDYRCEAVDRRSTSFLAEYDANGGSGERPYDYLYPLPYHRPMSGDCVAVPGVLPSNAYEFPEDDPATATYEGAIRFRPYTTTTGSCSFNQASDGILDAFERGARFGLMTFDSLPNALTGVNNTTPNYNEGLLGTWSYIWGSSRTANPAGCTDPPLPFEAGARNAAAPPWEGRMVAFGDPASGSLEYLTKKSQIERILLATRPYGATPIAGMMNDARDFFLNDDSADPLNPSRKFGPRSDPYVNDGAGCRDQFVILLTDGQPNLDMRPFCEGGNGGVCPFDKPETIAADMVNRTHPIETLVVPFAMPTFELGGQERSCNDLSEDDFDETDPTRPCGDPANSDNVALQACCALNRIAVAGALPAETPVATLDDPTPTEPAPPRAFFAESKQELASALSDILTSRMRVTSRTQPVISGAVGDVAGFRFFSLVRPVSFQPWVGLLQRQRFQCSNNVAQPQRINREKGDDFGLNIAANPDRRVFATIQAGNGVEPIRSTRTIRPFYAPSSQVDGAGVYGGTRKMGGRAAFVSGTSPDAMELTNTSCSGGLSATQCRDRYLNWLVGMPATTRDPFTRCPQPGGTRCYLLGDILHSTPRVVGPPNDLLRDETYEEFAAQRSTRPVVLYTSTNDGFLHAFKVAAMDPADTVKVDRRENNELWAFVPPAVLPRLPSQYPFTHQTLLDGVPVVKDVVATGDPASPDALRFQRIREQAREGATGQNTWRTVLVQSFGPSQGGYFALDVTDPVPGEVTEPGKGPRFLWQLTTDSLGNPLFGLGGATPLITTLFFTPPGATSSLEVPVAILPGGTGGAGTAGSGGGCPSGAGRDFSQVKMNAGFTPRPKVQCYSGAGLAGRSLTVVRLDTGEIIRTFRQSAAEIVDTDLRARVNEVDIDSPITGQPVAFPAETGAVADRVYVGDQDGRVWRVDLASENPADWGMELFFDAFPAGYNAAPTLHDFDDGQPIFTPPVLSVDEQGNITVNVATGDQETLGLATGMTNYVWSLTESSDVNRTFGSLETRVNWFQPLENGERVVGPLVLFNAQLFFSTFSPPTATSSACSNGTSRVWGMDYLRPFAFGQTNPPLDEGGAPRLPDPTDASKLVQVLSAAAATGDGNAVVFGVSVAQLPTCSQQDTDLASEFFGTQSTTRIHNVNPGQFQLVMHRGGVEGTSTTGDVTNNVSTIALQPPPSSSRVDSWAALLE